MEDDLYEAESIIDMKITAGRRFYLIKWKGYPMSECTWEPLEHLFNCSKMISDFENYYENQKALRTIKKSGRKRKRQKRSFLSKMSHQSASDGASSIGDSSSAESMSNLIDLKNVDVSSITKLVDVEQDKDEPCYEAEFFDGGRKWVSYNDAHQYLKDLLITFYKRRLNSNSPEI